MKILFTNGYIWDGAADARFKGEVLVAENRIEAVSRGWVSFRVMERCQLTQRAGH